MRHPDDWLVAMGGWILRQWRRMVKGRLGKILCYLGVHDNQLGGWNWPYKCNLPLSVWGGCVRPDCGEGWQYDN